MLRFTPEPADAGALCYKQKMRNDLSIREEKSKDFPFIRSLTEQAFINVPESDHTEHLLVERLRQSEAYIPELSLVAETNTEFSKKSRGLSNSCSPKSSNLRPPTNSPEE